MVVGVGENGFHESKKKGIKRGRNKKEKKKRREEKKFKRSIIDVSIARHHQAVHQIRDKLRGRR